MKKVNLYWSKTTKYQTIAIYCPVEHLHFRFEVLFTIESIAQLPVDGLKSVRCAS